MFEKIGGRKVILGILIIALGTVVDATGKNGLTNNLLDLLKYVFIAFCAGNVVNTVVATRLPAPGGVSEGHSEVPTPQVNITPADLNIDYSPQLMEIRQDLAMLKQSAAVSNDVLLRFATKYGLTE